MAVSAAIAAVLAVASCFDDPVGPALPFRGHFAVVPSFQSTASGIVPISSIRITLERSGDTELAVDTTIVVAAGQDSVSLALTVGMLTQSDVFILNLAMVSPAGDTVFRGGPMTVTPSASGENAPAIQVEITYTGVGADAASVQILTPDTSGFAGDTVAFTAEALDSADNVIPGTPIAWYTLDSGQASVPNPGTGTVVGGTVRGTARIVAQLLTNQADTAMFTVQPLPSAVVIAAGDSQTAVATSTLTTAPRVQVTADDALGVSGVLVRFQTANGSVAAESVLTDSSGYAETAWTLGAVPGTQTLTATVSGLADSSVTFTATALANGAVALESVSGNAQSGVVGTVLPESLLVRAVDVFGNPVANQRIDFTVVLGGGSLTSGTMATTDSGLAYDFWTLGALVADSQRVQVAIIDTVTTLPVAIVDFVATPLSDAPNQVGFTVQPSSTVLGNPFGAEVSVFDQYGNPVTGDNTTVVSLALAANPVTGTLSGTTAATVASGVATFTDLSIDIAGVGYTLSASASGLSSDTSAAFDIVGPPGVVYWVNPAGGNWSDGANWSTATMPGTADSAVIDLDGTYAVTLDVSDTVGYLSVGATTGVQTFSMAGNTLAIDSGGVFGPTTVYALSGGTLSGPATVVIDGALDWTGGTMSDSGATEVGPSGSATVSSPGPMHLSQRTFRNFGTMTWVSGTTWQLSGLSPTQFINESGATLTLAADLTLNWATTAAGKELINNGTIVATSGGTVNVQLTQNGTITVGSATLNVAAGSLGGTVDAAAGGVLRIFSGNVTAVPGFTFTGLGLVEVAAPGVGGLIVPAGDSLVLPRLVQTSGTVTGDGALTVTDSLHWAAGFQTGTGTTYIVDTAVAYVTTASTKELIQRTFRNFGTLTWDDGMIALASSSPTQLVNEAGATLTMVGARTLTFGTTVTGKELLNNGTVSSQPGVGNQTTIDVAFTNNGALVLDSGTTSLIGAFSHPTGALLRGNGTLDLSSATIVGGTLAGDVEPGTSTGMMTITGAFPQDAAASLNLEFAGVVAGTGYDVLNVTGAATLNGMLTVLDTVGFTPTAGLYPIMTFGTRTGAFSSVTLPTFAGLTVDTLYTSGQTPDTLYYVVADPLAGAPVGTEASWTGAVSSDWNTAGNWTSAVIPDDTTNVYVNGLIVRQPVVSADAYVDTLTLGSGATVTLDNPYSLYVNGNLDAGYTSIAGTGTVVMINDGTIRGSVPNLAIQFHTTAVDSVIVNGNLTLSGEVPELIVNGNFVHVTDSLIQNGYPGLLMNAANDSVVVDGHVSWIYADPAHLTDGVLVVGGNFYADSNFGSPVFQPSGNHRTVFNGSVPQFIGVGVTGPTLNHFQHLEVRGSADVTIDSSLAVAGDMDLLENAKATLAAGIAVSVGGNFSTADAATIAMTGAGTTFDVVGKATFDGGSTAGLLTAGMLQVGGDFTQLNTTSDLSYAASAGHTTQLSGDGIVQRVSFASPDSVSGSHFGILSAVPVSFNGDTLQFDTRAFVVGNVTVNDNNGDFPTVLQGTGELVVEGNMTTTTTGAGVGVYPLAVRISGSLALGAGTTFQPDTTEFFGGINSVVAQTMPNLTAYQNVVVSGDSVISPTTAGAVVQGDLIVRGDGHLQDGGADWTVNGNFSTQDNGTLRMDNGQTALGVLGSVTFGGGSTAGRLTDGWLSLGGDFTQTGDPASFSATGNHRVRFANTSGTQQSVSLANPDESQSHFGQLEITQGGTRSGINMLTDLVALSTIQAFGDSSGGGPQRLYGNGNTLTTGGLTLHVIDIDHVPLVFADTGSFAGAFANFSSINLVNYDSTETPITVIHNGTASAMLMSDVFFNTEAVGNPISYYLRARDNDGIIDFLTVNLEIRAGSATCWAPGNFVSEAADLSAENNAVINDVNGFCRFS